MSSEPIVIDATNQIMGRLASYAAKSALSGNTVIVLNAEKAVISGRKSNIVEEAKRRLKTRTLASQTTAPVHQRRPDLYLRRVVRGMLPWKKAKGKAAFHRVLVFMGVPEEYSKAKPAKIPGADASRLTTPYLTLAALAEEIGG
ncbi:MAG TPA: 50S ribosomal protein L13 [archaeon]|nr:50S ribosomal protein L13 [archaeon]